VLRHRGGSSFIMKKVSVGILGCGAIAASYLQNLQSAFSTHLTVMACADTLHEAASKRAAEFGIPKVCTVDELLRDPEIEIIVNLTPAPVHHATNLGILRAGKHVFVEKPLALSRAEGNEALRFAAQQGLQIAGAADTFLGASLQLCRKLIDSGQVGVPVAAHGIVALNMQNSASYHQVYRGPLLDMGPYYFTALVALLGPIVRVAGAAETQFAEKTDANAPGGPKTFRSGVPSTVSASLSFASGAIGSLIVTCDVHSYFPHLEIHGTEGSLLLNDANFYGGKVVLTRKSGIEVFETAPGFSARGRGLGLFEMAQALREGRPARSSGALMYHVLDAMLAVTDSSTGEKHVGLESRAERPAPFDYVG
jgi:predicted dehydrogenase